MRYDRDTVDTVPHHSSPRGPFDRLYDRVQRDLFARTIPGLLLLLSLAVSVTSFAQVNEAVAQASVWMWLLAWGAGWLTAFALLEIGRRFSLVLIAPEPITDEQYWALEERFRANASRRQRAAYERLITLCEATGTASVALFLSLLIVAADFVIDVQLHERPWNEVRNGAIATSVLIALGVALQLMHRAYVRRAWKYLGYVTGSPPA